jgi:2-succinyl-5-enolpyruvyl-6-hydroxy-3-cyclohexene-1-carboxylate synthase
MNLVDAPSVQMLWATLIVEELTRLGVSHVVLPPGSRSTPLVVAAVRHPRIHAHSILDERGAAYYALGIGRSTGRPAAVVTTSGTAVANLLPAAVEADADGVPLLLLTADRPFELRETGANQTIRQSGLLDGVTRWSFDLPAPNDTIAARTLLTVVDEAVARARAGWPGPVHLNLPFRAPLAPEARSWNRDVIDGLDAWMASDAPLTRHHARTGVAVGDPDLAGVLARAERGVVVLGSLPAHDEAGHGLVEGLLTTLGWPILADARSGFRLGTDLPGLIPFVPLAASDPAVRGFRPDVVLQLGARLVSSATQSLLEAWSPARYVLVDPAPARRDPIHRVTDRVEAEIGSAARVLAQAIHGDDLDATREGPDPDHPLIRVQRRVADAMDLALAADEAITEPWLARAVTARLRTEDTLVLSSSLPVREVNAYGATDGGAPNVVANRGASGIDGVLATACGAATGSGRSTTLLIGDLAFLHDLSSLAILAAGEIPVRVVLVNNRGGQIFSLLPIADHEDVYSPWFDTPHNISPSGACADFGIRFARVDTRADAERALDGLARSDVSGVLEVVVEPGTTRDAHDRIADTIRAALEDGE